MLRSRLTALCLIVVLCSCGSRRHYEPAEIVNLPPEDREVLFDKDAATDIVRQQLVRKYYNQVIQWTGRVINVTDDGEMIMPLRLTADVCNVEYRLTPDCAVYFKPPWREDLSRLKDGDTVTIVGQVWRISFFTLEFYPGELIRAERDGKQIYPPPAAEGEGKTEGQGKR